LEKAKQQWAEAVEQNGQEHPSVTEMDQMLAIAEANAATAKPFGYSTFFFSVVSLYGIWLIWN